MFWFVRIGPFWGRSKCTILSLLARSARVPLLQLGYKQSNMSISAQGFPFQFWVKSHTCTSRLFVTFTHSSSSNGERGIGENQERRCVTIDFTPSQALVADGQLENKTRRRRREVKLARAQGSIISRRKKNTQPLTDYFQKHFIQQVNIYTYIYTSI